MEHWILDCRPCLRRARRLSSGNEYFSAAQLERDKSVIELQGCLAIGVRRKCVGLLYHGILEQRCT